MKLTTIAAVAVGLLTFAVASRAAAQTTPTAAASPANAPPAVPAGMKVTCMQGPNVLTQAANCPVLKWHGYTYWAYSYSDNRVSMGIVAYDPSGAQVAQWERPGARYVYAITVDGAGKKVTFAGQSDQKVTMTWDQLFPPPVVVQDATKQPPVVPPGMKVTCTQGPGTGAAAATCPVIKWGGYTYWALSYVDNRVGMALVAYDSQGKIVKQWEKTGARYVHAITVDPAARTVTLAGQADNKIVLPWGDLFPPPAATVPPGTRWAQVPVPAGATFKQIAIGSANDVWALDTAGYPWKWNGKAWDRKAGTVSTIAVAADGTVWATNPPDHLRVLKLDVANNKWAYNIPTGMKQVTAVDANVAWGLDNAGNFYTLSGNSWEKKGCCASQIAVGADGELWSTTASVQRWDGAKFAPSPAVGIVQVSVGDADNIWAVDESDIVYQWNGTAWAKKPGTLSQVAAASDGSVWALNRKGKVFRWVP